MGINGSAGGVKIIRAPKQTDFDFTVNPIEDVVVVSQANVTRITVNDAVKDVYSTSTTDNQFTVLIWQTSGKIYNGLYEITASNGAVNGYTVDRVADGSCRILVRTPWLTKAIEVTFARTSSTTSMLVNFVPGSLARHLVDSMNTLFVTGKSKAHYSFYSPGTYIRNTNCWTASIDFTCASAWNSESGISLGVTAITPRHAITCAHWLPSNGMQIDFVTAVNATVSRTVESQTTIPNTDIRILKLNADLPNTIAFAKVMPATLENYLPSLNTFRVPSIAFDGEKKTLTKELEHVFQSLYWVNVFFNAIGTLSEYTETIIGGDSGNPIFLIIDNAPVILSTWGGGTNGAAIHKYLTEINSALTSLGGGYQLTQVNLAEFTSY